jgi:hypothetical protein
MNRAGRTIDREKIDREKIDREKIDREKIDHEKINHEKMIPPEFSAVNDSKIKSRTVVAGTVLGLSLGGSVVLASCVRPLNLPGVHS